MQIQKCFGLLLPVVMTCAGADVVKQGKPCADIVISENADAGTVLAAKDLQTHLHKISGARLAIVTPGKVKSATLLCVGESAASKKAGYKSPAFKTSGYDIWVKGNCIVLNGPVTNHKKAVIAGKMHPNSAVSTLTTSTDINDTLKVNLADDNGIMHAVSAFLEHLGVRFYSPYKDGTIIPKLADIRVGDFRETKEAAFARREFRIRELLSTDNEAVLWFKRLKSGSALPKNGTLAIADIIKAGEKQHPEWAAKNGYGELLTTGDGCVFPKLSEKSLQQAIAKAAIELFDANPEMTALHIVTPALRGSGDDKDLRENNPGNIYPYPTEVNIMAKAYGEIAQLIAKKHPGKQILWQSLPGRGLPSHGKYPAELGYLPTGVSPVAYAAANSRKKYLAQLPKISNFFQMKNVEQLEWWNEFSCSSAIRQGYTFPRKLQEVRKGQKGIISGFLMDAAVDSKSRKLAEVPLMHFMYYVNSKLLWDPELDLAALIKEYCTLWFGSASEEMYTFMNLLESISDRPKNRSISVKNGQLMERDIPAIFELLNKAVAKTPAKSIYRARVQAVSRSLAGLKNIFAKRTPRGRTITGEILPWTATVDCNLTKYKKWHTLPAAKGAPKTEFAIAFTEDRSRVFVAFRCYEPEMKKLKTSAETLDDCRIFENDHIRIDYNMPEKTAFTFAADSRGIFLDGSNDSDELARYGSFTGSERERSFAKVKHFNDRWEIEVSLHTQGSKNPDWNPAWGLNITRVRTVSGKTETYSLAKNAVNTPSKWRKFVIPCKDSKGNKTYLYATTLSLLPGAKAESTYTVKRAKGKVSLSDPWNEKSWKDVPELRLVWESRYFDRSAGNIAPDARAKFQYDDKYIYVLYQVKDRFVRGNFKNDQDMVCLDSCMEFFVQPDPAGPYYNFECNCIGTLLLYEIHVFGDIKKMSPMPAEELKSVKRFSTLPRNLKGELPGPLTWYLGLQIPIEMFARRTGVSTNLSGQVWHANVFKCADWTSNKCWLLWHKSYTFHNPDGFGKFIFE